MYSHQRASSTIAAIVVLTFSFSATCNAHGGIYGKGKLVLTPLSHSSEPPGLDRPPCKAPPLCISVIHVLQKSLKVARLAEIGILVTTVTGDIELGAFALEIRSNNKVVFATEPIKEVLKASETGKPASYLFLLDADAIEAGGKFFVPENSIGFTAKATGKGADSVTFSFVNASIGRANDTDSNRNKQPTQKPKPR